MSEKNRRKKKKYKIVEIRIPDSGGKIARIIKQKLTFYEE